MKISYNCLEMCIFVAPNSLTKSFNTLLKRETNVSILFVDMLQIIIYIKTQKDKNDIELS